MQHLKISFTFNLIIFHSNKTKLLVSRDESILSFFHRRISFSFFLNMLQSNNSVVFLIYTKHPERRLSWRMLPKLLNPTFDSFGNNQMIKKHFYRRKERAPFEPPIKVICILPVVCCDSETRVSRIRRLRLTLKITRGNGM